MRAFFFALTILVSACGPAKPAENPDRSDTEPTPVEAKQGDPCTRARANLVVVCPKMVVDVERLSKTDYVSWCRYETTHDQPICPDRIAHVKTCTEAAHACE